MVKWHRGKKNSEKQQQQTHFCVWARNAFMLLLLLAFLVGNNSMNVEAIFLYSFCWVSLKKFKSGFHWLFIALNKSNSITSSLRNVCNAELRGWKEREKKCVILCVCCMMRTYCLSNLLNFGFRNSVASCRFSAMSSRQKVHIILFWTSIVKSVHYGWLN